MNELGDKPNCEMPGWRERMISRTKESDIGREREREREREK
jgi:hypothetical protein